MKKTLSMMLSFSLFFSFSAKAEEYEKRGSIKIPSKEENKKIKRGEVVKQWKKVEAVKGYILSHDIYYSQHCTPTWSKHVKVFKQQNPNIQNPNIIPIGAKFEVQECDPESSVEVASTPAPAVKEESPAAVVPSKETKKSTNNQPMEIVYLDLYGGIISEEKQKDASALLGAGIHGDLATHVGYDLHLLYSSIVAVTEAEVRFKTTPDKMRYVLLYGMGNRIGIHNSDLDRVNKGVDSYSFLGLGLEMRPSDKHLVIFDVSQNIASGANPNFSATAQKKVGEDKWLGVFIEYNSTKSKADERSGDRRYLTGGLKFSF